MRPPAESGGYDISRRAPCASSAGIAARIADASSMLSRAITSARSSLGSSLTIAAALSVESRSSIWAAWISCIRSTSLAPASSDNASSSRD